MAQQPQVQEIEEGDEYYHVRFHDPDDFEEIRTPDWAANVANSVSEGAEVRMGDEKGNDDWEVQSVLIKKQAGKEKSQSQAQEIVGKIRDSNN